jgi:hypothetical protein
MSSEPANGAAKTKRSFLASRKSLSAYFAYEDIDAQEHLPVFIGREDERVDAWRALAAHIARWSWCMAAIAANLIHANGKRTDRGKGPTAIQQFCRAVRIDPAHCSRMARTYRVFAELLLDTDIKKSLSELLVYDGFTFKHFYVARAPTSSAPTRSNDCSSRDGRSSTAPTTTSTRSSAPTATTIRK